MQTSIRKLNSWCALAWILDSLGWATDRLGAEDNESWFVGHHGAFNILSQYLRATRAQETFNVTNVNNVVQCSCQSTQGPRPGRVSSTWRLEITVSDANVTNRGWLANRFYPICSRSCALNYQFTTELVMGMPI